MSFLNVLYSQINFFLRGFFDIILKKSSLTPRFNKTSAFSSSILISVPYKSLIL